MCTLDNNWSEAVSEVFGVMLMLTVTLILAGLVSAFASGMGSDANEHHLQVTIKASDFIVDDKGNTSVFFDHISGDPFTLNSTEFHLGSRDSSHKHTIISNKFNPTGVGDGQRYLESYPDSTEKIIRPGDRFILRADGKNSDDKTIYWQREGANRKFEIESGDFLTYNIIDRSTGMPISSGQIAVPDFD